MIAIQNVLTADDLVAAVCKVAKEKKWHTFVGSIGGKAIRVKVYGLWPQVFDVDGIRHGSSCEFNTQKALKAFMLDALISVAVPATA